MFCKEKLFKENNKKKKTFVYIFFKEWNLRKERKMKKR